MKANKSKLSPYSKPKEAELLAAFEVARPEVVAAE
jgi:hypothetical protein